MRQPYSQYAEPEEEFALVGEERDELYARPDRRLPTIFVTMLVMALFAGGLYFAYVQGTHHAAGGAKTEGGVPLIRADTGPTKIKPDQPGGMAIPDQNVSVYNEKPGVPAVEKLLPSAEKPMPRPAPPPPSAAASAPSDAAAPAPQPAPAQVAVAPPPAPVAPIKPKPEAAAKPASAKAEAAKPEAAKAEAGGGPVKLHLGSLRTPDAAREEWQRLKHDNPDLLGKLTAVAVRSDLGDKGIYYRIEAGPVSDRGAAAKLCDELKRRNFGCILGR